LFYLCHALKGSLLLAALQTDTNSCPMKRPLALCCSGFLLLIAMLAIWSCDTKSEDSSRKKNESDLIFAEQLKNRGSYDSALIYFRKAADYNLAHDQYPEWTRSVSGLIDCFRAKGSADEAMKFIDQALGIAITKLDTTGNLYNGFIHKKALLYNDKRQFEQASALFNRNIRTYKAKSATPDSGLALSYNGMGTVFLFQNNFNEALKEYQKAVDTYEKSQHTRSSNYASSLQNIGIVYSMTGNYEKAEQYFLRSLKVNLEVLESYDPRLASFYLNMGRFYQIVRNDSKSIEYMKLAENFYISQNQSNSIMAGSLFLNMGVLYIYTGDYEKAQSYLDKSLEIILTKTPDNRADLLTLYLNMGFIAEKKRDYAIAKDYYLKGLSIGDKLPNSVKVLRGLANVSYKMSDKTNADIYYKMALQKSIEMFGNEHPETALTYLRYGDFLSDIKDKQALFYLNKSLDLYKKSFGNVNIDVSTAYNYIGNYYTRIKNYSTAISFYQLSLIAGFPEFTSRNVADNPEISSENLNDNLLNSLTRKATVLLSQYVADTTRIELLKNSVTSFNLSLKMIEMLRSTYQDEDSKLFISGNEKNTFSNALLAQVNLYHKTHDPEALNQAFSLAEKSKSAVLLSHLRDKEAKNVGGIPEELQAQDASLKSEIYFYNKQIHDQQLTGQPDEEKIKMWNGRIFDLSRKQDELIKSIEKNYPEYYNLKYDNSVISIDQIQKKLTSKQAVVEFSLTDSTIYIFAVNAQTRQLVTRSIDKSFSNNLSVLMQQLAGKEYNNYSITDFKAFVQASYSLYQTLLFPVESVIKGKELIIIPDGELGYISFDVLLTSNPDTTKQAYKNLPYLIKNSSLTYAPSATTFFNDLNLKRSENNGRILAFGPDYGTDNTVLDQKDENGKVLRNSLTTLGNTLDEIKNLENYYNVTAFLGENATENAFKKNASDYRVLHLAMHTIINNENPLYSKLIFFKPKGDSIDDGMLNASELINMDLHADLAVLSACNTGSGKMQKGEGVLSLSRDFFYAGVPGIIMTAWAVEDRAGVKLMEYFYKNIALGKPRHEALRLAKIEYLDNCDKLTAHPHYWASYMNVGDISPLKGFGKKATPFSLYGAAATLFAIGILIFIRLRKKRNNTRSGS